MIEVQGRSAAAIARPQPQPSMQRSPEGLRANQQLEMRPYLEN